ncbi:hypothetical protein DW922_14390 [Clostridium sp. AM42-4]|nr:hypothetical protein DW922_14390 [Clostridium sp. AM42-4]
MNSRNFASKQILQVSEKMAIQKRLLSEKDRFWKTDTRKGFPLYGEGSFSFRKIKNAAIFHRKVIFVC